MRYVLGFLLLTLAALCHADDAGMFFDGFELYGDCAMTQQVRTNLAISITKPEGGSDLRLRAKIALPAVNGDAAIGALIAEGGTAPYVFSEVTSTLATLGVSIDPVTGFLSGTYGAVGLVSFVAQVEDAALATFECTFSINVFPKLTALTASPIDGEKSASYNYQFSVANPVGTIIWAISPSLIITHGMYLNTSTGMLDTMGGAIIGSSDLFVNFTITATDGTSGEVLVIPCSIYIFPELDTPIVTPDYKIVVGVPTTLPDAGFFGGNGAFKFFVTSSLPAGLQVTFKNDYTADVLATAAFDLTPIDFTVTDNLGGAVPAAFTLTASAVNNDGTLSANSDSLFPTQKAVKSYVDALVSGSEYIRARLATAAALPTNAYLNGTSGVGATLTGISTGVLTVDGAAVVLNDIVLVQSEAAPAHNGAYQCNIAGAIGVAYQLTRVDAMDEAGEFTGALVTTGPDGSANSDIVFECTAVSPVVVGATPITFQSVGMASGFLRSANNLSDVASAIASIDNISKISTPIVAATTTDLTTATGDSVSIVGGGGGPATITSLGNGAPGIRRVTAFAAICTLVHNPSSMDLITSADITVAVGDRCEWAAVGSNQWLMLSYDRADGTPLVGGGGGSGLTNVIRAASATVASNTRNRVTASSVALTTPASPADFDIIQVLIESGALSSDSVIANGGQTVNGLSTWNLTITPCFVELCYDLAATNWFVTSARFGTL